MYFVGRLCGNCFIFLPSKNYNAICSATELDKQNPRDRTLDLPFLFRYKHIQLHLKPPFSWTRREFALMVPGQRLRPCYYCCYFTLQNLSLFDGVFANIICLDIQAAIAFQRGIVFMYSEGT